MLPRHNATVAARAARRRAYDADYAQAIAWQNGTQGGNLLLYIDGVALPNDAQLTGVEHRDGDTHLRYRINQGPDTQVLWSSLYRDRGLLGTDSLRPAFGWSSQGPGATAANSLALIAVTSASQAGTAGAVLALLLVGLWLVGWLTDALRDAPLPTWWRDARDLRTRLRAPGAAETTVLAAVDPAWSPARRADCIALARAALEGAPVAADRLHDVAIGLALSAGRLRPVRASFSLARVQMAMWFAFALAAGIFLWIIYGQLRRIDGSLLGLLMISVGTAGVSLGTDRDAGGRPWAPSQGLFLDLVTGFDDSHQVHRYQSVAVNLLLLFVGVAHVVEQLTYPIFDATWLGLLGVSGAALGLGKQTLEKPADAPPSLPATPAADGSVG